MNKAEFIEVLATHFDGNRAEAGRALQAITQMITYQVSGGEKVTITGFVFEKVHRPARLVRNPRTGERQRAKATAVPRFRAGSELKHMSGAKKAPKATKKTAAELGYSNEVSGHHDGTGQGGGHEDGTGQGGGGHVGSSGDEGGDQVHSDADPDQTDHGEEDTGDNCDRQHFTGEDHREETRPRPPPRERHRRRGRLPPRPHRRRRPRWSRRLPPRR